MQFMPSIVKEFLKRFQIYPKQIFFSGLRGCIKMLKLTQFRKRASNNLNKKRFVLQNTYMKKQNMCVSNDMYACQKFDGLR